MAHNKDSEAKVLASIREIYAEKVPFNKVLGLDVVSLAGDSPVLRFSMRPELVGNYLRVNLHGGVISAVIDTCGSLTACLGLVKKLRDEPIEERLRRFARIGTIDMRVDYLRPGLGRWFEAKGYILRTGNKVAVTRMELYNDTGELIAIGTGAYTVA